MLSSTISPFPAIDGHVLGATLVLPRAARLRHAVLTNSAAAVPRKIYRTLPLIKLLFSAFKAAAPEIISVTPEDAGAKAIGHFGFFRPEHRDTLWRGAAEWMERE